jgi:hypothetical protein
MLVNIQATSSWYFIALLFISIYARKYTGNEWSEEEPMDMTLLAGVVLCENCENCWQKTGTFERWRVMQLEADAAAEKRLAAKKPAVK